MNNSISTSTLTPLLSLTLLALWQPACAQHELDYYLSLSLEDLLLQEVMISTTTKQTIKQAPAIVTVITQEDIKKTGASNLVDILEGVPGIHVRPNFFAFRPQVLFRGATINQTLMMVNGVPVKDLMDGLGLFWKGVPASVIERVEIIRGSGSALYGSDAAAGVINVITKTAGKIKQSEAGVRVGSYDNQTAWLQHGTEWNGLNIGFTAEISDTQGHAPWISSDGQTLIDGVQGSHASYAPGHANYGWRNEDLRFYLAKDHWRLQFEAIQHRNMEIGFTGNFIIDPLARLSERQAHLDLLYNNAEFSPDWGLEAELRYRLLDYQTGAGIQNRPPGFTVNGLVFPRGIIDQMQLSERSLNMEVKGLYSGFSDHQIRLGAGTMWQDLYSVQHSTTDPANRLSLIDISDTPAAFVPEKLRKIHYLFAQDVWTLSHAWSLTAGVRYDHYSDFGGAMNPRFALVWQSSDKLTSKLLYGEGFRVPTFQELYCIKCGVRPNADLSSEKSANWDLSFVYSPSKKMQLGFGLFNLKLNNLIDEVSGQFYNAGNHTINGVELEAIWQATPALRVSANYSHRFQHEAGQSVLAPAQDAYVRMDWGFKPKWNWNMQVNWLSAHPRLAGDARPEIGAQSVADMTLRHSPRKNWELAASIRNIFDADLREYTGNALQDDLPLPGLNMHAEINYKFK